MREIGFWDAHRFFQNPQTKAKLFWQFAFLSSPVPFSLGNSPLFSEGKSTSLSFAAVLQVSQIILITT